MSRRNYWMKKLIGAIIILFFLMNVMAIFHSYKLTHFDEEELEKTKNPKELNFFNKLTILFLGVSNPRPVNGTITGNVETIRLKSNKEIECWLVKIPDSKGTVILFHGYSGEKSSMLDKSKVFNELGYSTFLVDFMGSGGSEGSQTTIGFYEAMQVSTCFNYLKDNGEENIYLFGTSMGAVAIMKAISDYEIKPRGIVIECPFGTMYETVSARFKIMNLPAFPMAGLLVFWGGVQNGFWAFGHQPVKYAKQINCATLLLYGGQDPKVSKDEIEAIYRNLNGGKTLKIYPNAAHENYLNDYKKEWASDVREFIQSN